MVSRPPSFVIRLSAHVSAVDWIVAPPGYRTFRVGQRLLRDDISRIYCPEAMSNAQASRQLSLCKIVPPMFDSEEWLWRELEDFETFRARRRVIYLENLACHRLQVA
jgi:hypothetical protein